MTPNIIELLDGFSRQSRLLITGSEKLILKEYNSRVGLVKWFMVNVSSTPIKPYPYTLSSISRMEREVSFFKASTQGFKKPRIHVVDYIGVRVIRDYIEGEKISYESSAEVYEQYGRNLGMLHCSGWALGDTKLSNFVYNSSGVYVIDAEQAIKTNRIEHYAWDIAVFASTFSIGCYSTCILNEEEYTGKIKSFIEGYLETPCSIPGEVVGILKDRAEILLLIPFPLNFFFLKTLKTIQKHT